MISQFLKNNERDIQRVAIFVGIGLFVNAIYITLFICIVSVDANSRLLASTISYILACLFQYIANAYLTFSQSPWDRLRFLRYILTISIGYILSTFFLTEIAPPLRIPDLAALCGVAISLPVLNFLLFKGWVYKASRNGVPSDRNEG